MKIDHTSGFEDGEEDPVEEFATEAGAAATAAEMKEVGNRVLREHARTEAEQAQLRCEELYGLTLAKLSRAAQVANPLRFVQSQSREEKRSINVRWEVGARRHIVLEFDCSKGVIGLWQLTNAYGADVPGGRHVREIEAGLAGADAEIERAVRWVWHEPPEAEP